MILILSEFCHSCAKMVSSSAYKQSSNNSKRPYHTGGPSHTCTAQPADPFRVGSWHQFQSFSSMFEELSDSCMFFFSTALVRKYSHWLPIQQSICLKLGLTVYNTLNACQRQYLKSILFPRIIIIQTAHLIIFIWSYLRQEMFLVNEIFQLLNLNFATLSLFIYSFCSFACVISFST